MFERSSKTMFTKAKKCQSDKGRRRQDKKGDRSCKGSPMDINIPNQKESCRVVN